MAGRKTYGYLGRAMRVLGRGNSKCIFPRPLYLQGSVCDQQHCLRGLRDTQSPCVSESDASASAVADSPAWAVSKLSWHRQLFLTQWHLQGSCSFPSTQSFSGVGMKAPPLLCLLNHLGQNWRMPRSECFTQCLLGVPLMLFEMQSFHVV